MARILCLGDSITDCGRLFSADPLGKGYVKQLSCLLHNTDHRFSIENRGIDGFTLERLLQNTDFWLESSDPDIVTVLIGINDVGIMMNTRRSSAQQQDLMNKFVTRYELLAKSYPAQTPGNESSISWTPLFFHGHAATLPGLPFFHRCPCILKRSVRIMAPFFSRCRTIWIRKLHGPGLHQ